MATPRVFISSTCYDLSEIRDVLGDFVRSYGFEPVLSERGDIFYHPDLHTHESCLSEVRSCHLMILIIGGRFGGRYVADTEKSVVNAEYSAARERDIPCFTFIKRDVHSDHFVYTKNKNNTAVDRIDFPSIEEMDYVDEIFDFIDEVRSESVGNSYFTFDHARDITALLRKQWAGMLFEFLHERAAGDRMRHATSLARDISLAGERLEELVNNFGRQLDALRAAPATESYERQAVARDFFSKCPGISWFRPDGPLGLGRLLEAKEYAHWYEYIAAATGGAIGVVETSYGVEYVAIEWDSGGWYVRPTEDIPGNPDAKRSRQQQERFEVVKTLDIESLKSVVLELDDINDG